METHYRHLGQFSDLVAAARALRPLHPLAPSLSDVRRKARETLRFNVGGEQPRDPRSERRWQADGVDGEENSWSVGFGPRTRAWVLKPADIEGPLPAIVALHDHGHHKYFGKEKIADGPDGPLERSPPSDQVSRQPPHTSPAMREKSITATAMDMWITR